MIKASSYGIFCLLLIVVTLSTLFWLKKVHNIPTQHEIELDADASDNPIAREAYEFNMIKNPITGTIPDGIYERAMRQAMDIQERQGMLKAMSTNTYSYQGPDNLGGRTKTIAYDIRFNGTTNKIILAGGISGGVFKSIDNGVTWIRKSPINQLFSVTSLAQDRRAGFQDTWYYATGEAIGNSTSAVGALYMGNGIYKSTDNGETWVRLPNSNSSSLETFNARQDLISKVIVDPNSGDVYFGALDGIYRSQDGGTSWSLVLSSGAGGLTSKMVTDIVCTTTIPTRFYAAFSGVNNSAPTNMPGVWTSTIGGSGTWTKIAGETAPSNPINWNADNAYGRVVLAIAPSNENIVYALYDNFTVYPQIEAELFKWDQSAGTWVDLSSNLPDESGAVGSSGNDPFAIQGGYDLVLAVKPDDVNAVFIGGTNIYRSTDGFSSSTNYARIGGYAGPSTYSLYANSHSDIHSIVFEPGNTSVTICGNDGGIQRTTNNLAASVVWTDISSNYRTYQFYYVSLDPRSGNSKVLGGAQDNGTTRNIGGAGTNFERVLSGDGVSVGLSDLISGNTYEYAGSQLGSITRRNSSSAPYSFTNIRPTNATDNGLFVTLFKLDNDNTENIYYASDSSLYRNTSASTATPSNWTLLTGVQNTVVDGTPPKTQITALATTRGNYNAATSSLFIGTNEGRIYRLDDPANVAAATAPVNISSASFPSGAYMSSISVNPRNDDTVLVTFSNYGVSSVFWTGNANAASPTWLNVEGTLTLPSYRSSVISVTGALVEYFVGTSVGLYKATIDGNSPATTGWLQEGAAEIGNAPVTNLAYRTIDNRLLAGTHGFGMWATTVNQVVLPVTLLNFNGALNNNGTLLKWTTSDEQSARNFEIEKSGNGNNFYRMGIVTAQGYSQSVHQYSFFDQRAEEINYYRLKMNDMNGNSKYSNVVIIRNNMVSQAITILNNPFANEINLRFTKKFQQLNLQLFNASGQMVAQKQIKNATEVHWTLQDNLSKGVYILNVETDGRKYTNKLIRN